MMPGNNRIFKGYVILNKSARNTLKKSYFMQIFNQRFWFNLDLMVDGDNNATCMTAANYI